MRYFLEITYNGKNYFGWQRQPNQISIQQVLEETLSTILRQKIFIVGAGRTDSGVHALQQFAHVDLNNLNNTDNLIYKLNSFLPKDIAIKNIFQVTKDAHARFDAKEREYVYKISLSKNPFTNSFAYQVRTAPALDLMNLAAQKLLLHKDFQCFSRSNTDVKTYFCDIMSAQWKMEEEQLIFRITADRFLRNMVRAIVGTLFDVGLGKTSLEEFQNILDSKSREMAGASAPAHGLYLAKIIYPKSIFYGHKV